MAYIWAEKAPNFVPYQSQCMKNPAEPRDFCGVHCKPQNSGGWGGIRTPGGVAPTTVFKTVAIDRSATHPKLFYRRSFNLRFCSLTAPGGAAHHSFALDCADACLADSYARPSQSTAALTHPKLFTDGLSAVGFVR